MEFVGIKEIIYNNIGICSQVGTYSSWFFPDFLLLQIKVGQVVPLPLSQDHHISNTKSPWFQGSGVIDQQGRCVGYHLQHKYVHLSSTCRWTWILHKQVANLHIL